MPVRGIRLTGLFDSAAGTNAGVLQDHLGFRLVRDGADWVIPDDDPALLAGPKDILATLDRPFKLREKDFQKIADEYVAHFLASDLEAYLGSPPRRVVIPGGFGISSTVEEARNRFYFSKGQDISRALVTHVFPVLKSQLGARFALPVKVNVSYQQALISLPKITLLLKLFGKDDANKRIFTDRALGSILPTPVEILGYLDALLFLSPFTFSLPISRPGSALYFLGDQAWQFPKLAAENIFEQFASDVEPAVSSAISGLFASPGVGAHGMRSMLMCAIDAVNGLTRFLNDPRNFLVGNCEFDQQWNVKAQSAVRLLFADLLAMNFTSSFHVKHRLGFMFLDKLANLVSLFSPGKKSETDIFKELLSKSMAQEVAAIVYKGTVRRHRGLSEVLRKSILRTYDKVHDQITLRADDSSVAEGDRLSHIRTLRNLGHGTNLYGQKFEQTFFGGAPTIPPELTYIPFFLALALGFDAPGLLRR